MSRLFHLVARPLATSDTEGAFLGGRRIMAVDGTVFDVPDTVALFQSFWISSNKSWDYCRFPQSQIGAVD